MRILLILFGFLGVAFSSNAQNKSSRSTYFLEINMARFTETPGLFENYPSATQWDFMNGLKFGIQNEKQGEQYISLMKYASIKNRYYGFTGEIYSTKGYQIAVGFNKNLLQVNRLTAQMGGEFFFQISTYDGEYWTDYGTFDVDGIKRFDTGVAAVLQLNYRINQRMAITANSRFAAFHSVTTSNEYFDQKIGYDYHWDPLNALSLRVYID